jgi:lactoylglutathione lyase
MMSVEIVTSANVKQAVPFFGVTNMEASLRFYVEGLGFKMKRWWIPDQADGHNDYKPDGKIRWCWLELGEAAIMLQEFLPERQPKETLGTGVQRLFSVRGRAGAVSGVQIARNPDSGTPISRKLLVGCAGN